jgi:hypothetical protein
MFGVPPVDETNKSAIRILHTKQTYYFHAALSAGWVAPQRLRFC